MIVSHIKSALPLGVLGILRSFKRSIALASFKERVVSHDFVGVKLSLHISDPVGAEWYDHDSHDLEELGPLLKTCGITTKKSVFVLGAHQGVVSLVVAKNIDPAGKIVAVEGSAFNIGVGNKNLTANGNSNITLVHAIVAERPGIGYFVDTGNGYIGRNLKEQTVAVNCCSVDSLAEQYGEPDFVMMDIEGVEFVALRGSLLLANGNADWAIELHGDEMIGNYGGSNREVVEAFMGRNYEVYRFSPDTIPPRYVQVERATDIGGTRTHIFCRRVRV
jgi:FkbM family methyltransferase